VVAVEAGFLTAASPCENLLYDLEAEIALHNGDAGPRRVLWSHDPVILFGAEVTAPAGPSWGPTFDWLATRFTECTSLEYEIVAAGASVDLAYLVASSGISASANGGPASYVLRATTIFRREGECGGPSTATATATSRTRRFRCAGL